MTATVLKIRIDNQRVNYPKSLSNLEEKFKSFIFGVLKSESDISFSIQTAAEFPSG